MNYIRLYEKYKDHSATEGELCQCYHSWEWKHVEHLIIKNHQWFLIMAMCLQINLCIFLNSLKIIHSCCYRNISHGGGAIQTPQLLVPSVSMYWMSLQTCFSIVCLQVCCTQRCTAVVPNVWSDTPSWTSKELQGAAVITEIQFEITHICIVTYLYKKSIKTGNRMWLVCDTDYSSGLNLFLLYWSLCPSGKWVKNCH